MKSNYFRLPAIATLFAVSFVTFFTPAANAQAIEGFPLLAQNFGQSSQRGFGDRNNSWAQAMIWWQNNLYVGTSRQSICTSLYGVYLTGVAIGGKLFADAFLPYPPYDPDLSCAPDAADLSLQAEIWRWSPATNVWQRVFQSPATLDNPGSGPPDPPRTGKKLPYEIAFRGFAPFTEPNGTQALYAFGVNSTVIWDRSKLPPPRILRSTDGINWAPVPQTPGTFLGDLPFNADHSSFRSPASYNGKLFVLSGPIFGQGSLIGSANPAQGDNAWFLAGSPNPIYYELAVFNGWLYIGGFDPTNGYAVYKTKAEGAPPYSLITVVPPGAYLTVRPSKSVVSMHVFNNHLYVGTGTQTEIVRINTDDTWDLVIGVPRQVPSTGEWKYPISNVDAGFGLTLNDHAWQMEDPYNYLYTGTYNASTGSRFDPQFGPLLAPTMGAQLYRTPDDWYQSAVTTTGFSNLGDPHGGKFDFGVRTMASTPYGMFLGTANDYYGLTILRATKRTSPLVDMPGRLEVEPTTDGKVLLSWLAAYRATSYAVFRAEINQILVRDDLNIEGWNGITGNKIPDTYVGPYQQIGITTDLLFIDATTQPGHRYMYYVLGIGATGARSEQSNLTTYPNLLPPMTFARVLDKVNLLAIRQRFTPPDVAGAGVRQIVLNALTSAANCQLATAITQLNPQVTSRSVLSPDLFDAEIVLSKLVRRLQLYARLPAQVQTTEFCTTGH